MATEVTKPVYDESGKVPVLVDELQQAREEIADRGLAHASYDAKKPVQPEDLPKLRKAQKSSAKPARRNRSTSKK